MKFRALVAAVLALAALSATAHAQTSPASERPRVVVELYTSQGCSQCPRANRLLGVFSREPGVLALTFPVGIWDYLGWRDTLAQPDFGERQRDYSVALHVRGRFTPQLVFNGIRQSTASDWDDARTALDASRNDPAPEDAVEVSITRLSDGRVRVSLPRNLNAAGTIIWILAFDPTPVSVTVGGGININRTLVYYNLVDWMRRVDTWNGEAVWFEKRSCSPECAVFVQRPGGGRIVGAAYTTHSPRRAINPSDDCITDLRGIRLMGRRSAETC
jgi:hypothetical protein